MKIQNLTIKILLGAVFLFLLTAAFLALKQSAKPKSIVWDLRKGPQNIQQVNWPASVTANVWHDAGNFDLTIIESDGSIIFHYSVQSFTCEREGTKRTITYIYFAPRQGGGTGDEAYATAKNIMTTWKFLPPAMSDLEKWHEGIAGKIDYGGFVRLHEKANDIFGFNCGQYPDFEAGKPGGNVQLNLRRISGVPEDGTAKFVYSLSF